MSNFITVLCYSERPLEKSCRKFQSNRHHQQTNAQLFTCQNALPVAQPTVSKHWREIIYSMEKKNISKLTPTHEVRHLRTSYTADTKCSDTKRHMVSFAA